MRKLKGETIKCLNCKEGFYVMPSRIMRAMFCSERCKWDSPIAKQKKIDSRHANGKPWHSKATRRKMKANHKGSTGKHWKLSAETRKRQGDRQRGDKNFFWKGGATEKNWGVRRTTDYKIWRKAVLERDGHKCIQCGSKKRLEADHIKPYALFPELALAIDNGRTLCHECHKGTDTYAGRTNRIYATLQRTVS